MPDAPAQVALIYNGNSRAFDGAPACKAMQQAGATTEITMSLYCGVTKSTIDYLAAFPWLATVSSALRTVSSSAR